MILLWCITWNDTRRSSMRRPTVATTTISQRYTTSTAICCSGASSTRRDHVTLAEQCLAAFHGWAHAALDRMLGATPRTSRHSSTASTFPGHGRPRERRHPIPTEHPRLTDKRREIAVTILARVQLCLNLFNQSPWLGDGADLRALVRGASAAGFRLIGPDLRSIDAFRQSGGQPKELTDLLETLGLRCFEMTTLVIGPDPATATSRLGQFAALPSALRPEWAVTIVNCPDDEAVDQLETAARMLDEMGIGVALEFAPHLAMHSLTHARALLHQLPAVRAGVLIDTWHFFRGPNSWAELDEIPREEVAYVHFDDSLPMHTNDLVNETGEQRTMPGDGEFELTKFVAYMHEKGFDGVVSIEVLSDRLRDLDPEDFARLAMRSTLPFWS
jgi:sugar phosphate isomerase/epimerase